MSLRKNLPRFPLAPGTKNKLLKQNKKKKPFESLGQQLETSIYASSKASYTIEATVIMPLFITLMIFGIFVFRIIQVQTGVQQALDVSVRKFAVEGSTLEAGESSDVALLTTTLLYASNQMKNGNVPTYYIKGGVLGINMLESSAKGNYINLKANYTIDFPINLFGKMSYQIVQEASCRKWVGYDPDENAWDGIYVYVTPYGRVYHTRYDCPYLNPSIHVVSKANVSSLRNASGGKYYPCGCYKNSSSVYITDYGDKYHGDANCSSLKRTINKVLYEQVKDKMSGCSKCCGNVR